MQTVDYAAESPHIALTACLVICLFLTVACDRIPLSPDVEWEVPELLEFRIKKSPHNALSAIVSVRVRSACSAQLQYGQGSSLKASIDISVIDGAETILPIVGLDAGATYWFRLTLVGDNGSRYVSKPITLTTDTFSLRCATRERS